MKGKVLIVILFSLLLNSCATFQAEKFSTKVDKLEQGMTKKEVINILGNDYITIQKASYDTVLKKSVEIIRYTRKSPEKSCSIRFANGRLYDVSRI